ncbi:oligosaccharide repeat unit polymerase [Metabacillus sp. B2-18]|uniref:oligosaccharide repeat unit polymerase n=1 Tax=Metabacillus sp. B2-18 TaxID=2897333 RepID=UPI001E528C33|nr:oligosaccharide repeat unit polymerase [Metabacillus sp. B2-18]UGB30460.1 oligosaccharide repeat unit polymerase [Metabacillus sp. B2-18]
MLYITIWLIVAVLSFYLFKKSAGTMSILKPNLLSLVFYYSLFISSFIGSLLIALDIDKHYMINLLSDDRYRVIGFYTICFVMVMLPLSMYFVSNLIGFRAEKEFDTYLKSPIVIQQDKLTYLVYLGLTGLSLLSIAYTIYYLEAIPLVELLLGSSNLAELRIEAARGFQGNTLIRNIFAIGLTPILSMITFIYSYKTMKMKWIALFLITFSCSVFIQIYDLSKAPIFFYLLMFILLLLYLQVIKLTWSRVIALGTIAIGGIIVLYVVIQGVSDPSAFLDYNRGPVGRLILTQIAGYYMHLELFSDKMPLLMGQSLPSSIIGLYDIEQIRSARLAMEVYFPQRVEEGTAGVLNTLFAGEAFANFGYIGLILGTVYVGVFIQLIYIAFLRLQKNPLYIALFVYFTVNIPRVVIGGFTDFLLNTLWVAILIVLIAPFIFLRLLEFISQRTGKWTSVKE